MAKFCTGCGTQLGDAAKFCPSCGAQQVQAQQPNAPQHQQAYAPALAAPKKKSKAPLIIVGGAVALVVLIAVVAFSGRGGDNGPAPYTPGYSGGGVPTEGGNPGQAAQPPATQQPNGSINPDLVGQWGGALSGYSHYYDFKADGTFLYRIVNSIYVGGNYVRSENDYFRGTWYEADGIVYMTQRYYADFVGGNKPPDSLSWTKMPDQTMRIKFDINKDKDRLYYGRRCFFNLDIVYVTPDGSLPDAYLEVVIDNLPDWVFP